MKIKIDFGTKPIPSDVIHSAITEVENLTGLKAGKCVLYLNLYDNSGLSKIPCIKDGRTLNFIIRAKPYDKILKDNIEYIGKWSSKPEAHIYRQFGE